MEFNIFLIITLLNSLQLKDISDIFMVFILLVKVVCPLCSRYYGECSAVGQPSDGDGIESRRPWFCSPLSLSSFFMLFVYSAPLATGVCIKL